MLILFNERIVLTLIVGVSIDNGYLLFLYLLLLFNVDKTFGFLLIPLLELKSQRNDDMLCFGNEDFRDDVKSYITELDIAMLLYSF